MLAKFLFKHDMYFLLRGTGYMFSINLLIHHQALYKIRTKNKVLTCHTSTSVVFFVGSHITIDIIIIIII